MEIRYTAEYQKRKLTKAQLIQKILSKKYE